LRPEQLGMVDSLASPDRWCLLLWWIPESVWLRCIAILGHCDVQISIFLAKQ
jgi:hypothetical protein